LAIFIFDATIALKYDHDTPTLLLYICYFHLLSLIILLLYKIIFNVEFKLYEFINILYLFKGKKIQKYHDNLIILNILVYFLITYFIFINKYQDFKFLKDFIIT
jgi:hypothetical protein